MRIDRLEVENFKRFEALTIDFDPHFTLLTGDNGAGKTTVLDALAVAAAIWLAKPPDSMLVSSGRAIQASEIRLEAAVRGDRLQFSERKPVKVTATGQIGGQAGVVWSRQVKANGKRTTNSEAAAALRIIHDLYARDLGGEQVVCPVLANYGAGRAWLPSNVRMPKPKANGKSRRWAAFYDCFSERIRFDELQAWFRREMTERGNRGGRWRPGFNVVRHAILRCVDDADDLWFDADRDQIVLSASGITQPFENLSAGQRMMLAMVADLAIRAVTQNAFLVPGNLDVGDSLPDVLQRTPGLVLIDELEVHLHPNWQRRVPSDLKQTFPSIQFVCTSHSPQVIGSLTPEEIRLLDTGRASIPDRSFGIDSSRILEELMGARARDPEVEERLRKLFREIDEDRFDRARELLTELEVRLGPTDAEVVRASALMHFLEDGD